MNLTYILAILSLPVVLAGHIRSSSRVSQEIDSRRRFRNNVRDGIDEFDGGFKKTVAQKRQEKRDARRFRFHPDRTEDEELREKIRKRDQAYNRRNPEADPNDPAFGDEFFREKREIRRFAKCDRQARGCYYVADVPTYVRINRIQEDRRYNDRFFYDNDNRYYRGIGTDFDDEIIYRTDRSLNDGYCFDLQFPNLCDAIDKGDCRAICVADYRGDDKQACRLECNDLEVRFYHWD